MENDVRLGTRKIYQSRFKAFSLYCEDVGVNPTTCPKEVIVNFLAILRRVLGLSYQTVSGYRSAISKYHSGFEEIPAGQIKAVKRVTRACFNEVPPLPRYSSVWPIEQLLEHLHLFSIRTL